MTVPPEPAPYRVMDVRWWWWGLRTPVLWALGSPLPPPPAGEAPIPSAAAVAKAQTQQQQQQGKGKEGAPPRPFRFDPLRFALGLQVRPGGPLCWLLRSPLSSAPVQRPSAEEAANQALQASGPLPPAA